MSERRVEFRVNQKLKEQFQSLAKRKRTTVTQLLVTYMENYVASASLILSEPLIEDKSLVSGQPETASDLSKPLTSNGSDSAVSIQYVHSDTNCPDSTLADFQRQLVELNQEIELLKERYKTLNAFVETEAQTVLSEKMQSIISSTINNLRTEYGWQSPDEANAVWQSVNKKIHELQISYMEENIQVISTQTSMLKKLSALESFAKKLGYKDPDSNPTAHSKGKGFAPKKPDKK